MQSSKNIKNEFVIELPRTQAVLRGVWKTKSLYSRRVYVDGHASGEEAIGAVGVQEDIEVGVTKPESSIPKQLPMLKQSNEMHDKIEGADDFDKHPVEVLNQDATSA